MGLCDFTGRSATQSAGFVRVPVPYRQALDVQDALVRQRRQGAIPDSVWLLEHPPTITFGTSGGEEHLLVTRGELEARGYSVYSARRGGDITCHEPGQLVGYPIVDLDRGSGARDLHLYLRRLEDALILLLEEYGLAGVRIPGRTGVWLDASPSRKVAAIGVRCARWVTSHGFALNVENTLAGFGLIVPCGIAGALVTSLEKETGRDSLRSWESTCRKLHRALQTTLERPLRLLYGPGAEEAP